MQRATPMCTSARMASRSLLARFFFTQGHRPNHRSHGQEPVGAAYKALGLKNNASLQEVKAAYRRLALKCHPDLHSKGAGEFIQIKAAYELLSNYHNPAGSRVQAYTPRRPTDLRTYSGRQSINAEKAVRLWGVGLASSCVLLGMLLFWRGRIVGGSYQQKRPSRMIPTPPNTVTKKQIAALLIQKSKHKQESSEK